MAFLVGGITIPYSVAIGLTIVTLDNLVVYCMLSYYAFTIVLRLVIYAIPRLSEIGDTDITLKSVCRSALKAAAHLQDRMAFECITSLSLSVIVCAVMYASLQTTELERMYYLSIPVQTAYLLLHMVLIDMLSEYRQTIRAVNVGMTTVLIAVLSGLSKLFSMSLLYGFIVEAATTCLLVELFSRIQAETYYNSIKMLYGVVIN